jgi:hypothetical protein
VPAFLDPSSLPESAPDEADAPDEGVIVDGLGIARLGFRCWAERSSDPVDGTFYMLHRAAVWDATGRHVESRPAGSREAALNEALGRYLATAGATPQPPAAHAERDVLSG